MIDRPTATPDDQADSRPSREDLNVAIPGTSGHHEPGERAASVDDVLDDARAGDADHVTVSVPRGDVEALDRVKQRLDEESVRATGSTVLVEGTPKQPEDAVEGEARPAPKD